MSTTLKVTQKKSSVAPYNWNWSDLTEEEVYDRVQKRLNRTRAKKDWLTLDEFNQKVDTLIYNKKCVATRQS